MKNRSFRFLITAALVASAAVAAAQAPAAPGPGRGRGAFPPVQIGPPAPVPAAVAMLRPGPGELTEINAALQKFIAADKSSSSAVLKKYEPLILLQPPRLNTAATFTQTVQRMGPRHEGFVATAKAGNIDLLLHGDSITDWWVQNEDNKKVSRSTLATSAPLILQSPATPRRECSGDCVTAKGRAFCRKRSCS